MTAFHLPEKIKSFPVCLAVSALLSAVPCFVMDIFYLYGDDYLINYIANGSFGREFSAHLVFIKYPAGLVLSALYRICPGVNWYAAFLVGVFALSFACIHRCILLTTEHPAAILASLLMNAAAVPLLLTFTAVSFLAAAAGLAWLPVMVRRRKSFPHLLPGILLMVLSFLIRDNCLIPLMGIALPIYLGLLFGNGRRGDSLKSRLSLYVLTSALEAGAIVLVLIGAILLSERAAYSSREWTDFNRYNAIRSEYQDYPAVPYEMFQGEFQEAGFSQEAYLLVNRWTFCEKQVFSEKLFGDIAAIIQRAYSKSYRLRYMLDAFRASPTLYCLLLPLLLLLLLAATSPRWRRAEPVLTYLMFLLVLSALAFLRLRVLIRITVPITMSAVVFLLLSGGDAEKDGSTDRAMPPLPVLLGAAGLTLAILLSLVQFYRGYKSSVAVLRSKTVASAYEPLRKEMDSHPERIYAVESPIYVYLFAWGHTVDEIVPTDTFSHVIRAGSWDNFSPRYYAIARSCGISDPDNLLSSLLHTKNLRLVTEDEGYVLQFLNSLHEGTCEVTRVRKKGPARICSLREVPSS